MDKDILPQGDYIRQLLVKSNITNSNINLLLRGKGVFLGQNQKNNSVPLIMKSIISPKDFIELYETQKTKEEKIKYRTSTINCNSDFDLSDIFEDTLDLNTLVRESHTYKPNYIITGKPDFYFEDEQTAIIEYQIERENLLSDWTSNKTYHKGAVTLRKVSNNGIQVSVQQDLTSKETIEVNNLLISVIKEKLFSKTIIQSNDDILTIKYNHFDNSSRIQFFYLFTANFNIYLDFNSITDIDLYLDESIESHNDIKVFLDEIDNLKLKGKGLQKHILIKEKIYHPKLIFGAVKLKYSLEYEGVKGTAIVDLGFPDYVKSKDENADFQISIDLILNKQDKKLRTENIIRKKLLEFFEKKKLESYNKFKMI